VIGWLVDSLAPLWSQLAWWHDSVFPTLPLVAVANAATDVRSSVPGLFMAFIVGGLSALCIEVSKVQLRGEHRRSLALVLIAYQLLLFIDAFRGHARDWWVWTLSWFGLVRLESVDWHVPTLPVSSPWLALAGMVATLICLAKFELAEGNVRSSVSVR